MAGSADLARRPEAFYRFLMQYLDRELGSSSLTLSDSGRSQGLVDGMQGIDFVSIIQYATSKSKVSSSRALTVDLAYDQRWNKKDSTTPSIRFGEVLRYSLCKDAPLRAWNDTSKAYEAVIQRKIATSLPSLLSLSCCCAGKHADPLGLKLWQQEDKQNWLPESIEVTIETDRSITVKELVTTEDGDEKWLEFQQKLPLSASMFESIKDEDSHNLPVTKSYRLESVISFVRSVSSSSETGHHVLHVRVPLNLESEALKKQLQQVEACLKEVEQVSSNSDEDQKHLTLLSSISFDTLKKRQAHLQDKLSMQRQKQNSEWLLINGFVVTKVGADDVRSFNNKFKEPSIVVFRELTDETKEKKPTEKTNHSAFCVNDSVQKSVMETKSITDGRHPDISVQGKYYRFGFGVKKPMLIPHSQFIPVTIPQTYRGRVT